MKRTLWLILIAALAMLCACSGTSGSEGEGSEIALIPYASDVLGFSSLVPQSWTEIKPGHFQRLPRNDPTLLAQAAFHGATLEEIPLFQQLPEASGMVKASGLTWDLYQVVIEWPVGGASLSFDIALAEADTGAFAILLVTYAEEQEALHDAVMLPVIDAFVPGQVGADPLVTPPPPQVPEPIDTRVRLADGMTMVYIPAGEFQMGNQGIQWMWDGSLTEGNLNPQVFIDEGPQHAVYLDAYWFDQTEVTVGMFRAFVEATGYETSAERDGWGAPYKAGPKEEEWPHVEGADWLHPQGPMSNAQDDHPVVQVSWDDAAAYCAWAGGQLPSEAQWEKAARGTDGRLFPWGDIFDGNLGSFCGAECPVERNKEYAYDDGYPRTAPVGSFPVGASPYGALDMAGNVWEWMADWYSANYYGLSPYENPPGHRFGTERAQRGGAWVDNGSWVRTTVRHSTPGWNRCDDLGFRCAVPAD
ncbi:MAG: formylglycine-generating enzyme family protein [Anaerolineales bacterium]|jgi:formylglycine-generating enzyme required for sulfatase activity